jgi:hypothetical protein
MATESSWIEAIKIIASILFGGMAAALYNDRVVLPRESKKRDAKERLENFLIPLRFLLEETKDISKELVEKLGGMENFDLEGSLMALDQRAALLPDDDILKYNWKERLFRLQERNRYISDLINKNSGKIKTEEFREACTAFLDHAGTWEDMWKGLERYLVDEKAKINSAKLRASRFPKEFTSKLNIEIAEAEKLAK